jgi:hypothetical protein
MTHRKHRKAFAAYAPEYVKREIDPAFKMLNGIFSRYELSQEQRIWSAFLYAIFYQPATVFWVMQEFPDYEKVDLGRFKRWLHALGPKTVYNLFVVPDRKYGMPVRGGGSYQVEGVLDRYFAVMKHPRPQAETLAGMTFNEVTYNIIYKPKKTHRPGDPRVAGLCYAETLYRCCGYKFALPAYDEIADSQSNGGFAHLKVRPAVIAKVHPEWDPMTLETIGCAFRKLVDGRMYLGYYLDRMAKQINAISAIPAANGVHWETLWDIRKEQFAYTDRAGIKEERLDHYKRTGKVLPWPS